MIGHAEPNSTPYRVDGEVGRFEFIVHDLRSLDEKVVISGRELFPFLKGRQFYQTKGFKKVGMLHGAANQSFRKVTENFNWQRRQEDDGTPLNTLRDSCEREGQKIVAEWRDQAVEQFEKFGLNADGEIAEESPLQEAEFKAQTLLTKEEINAAINELNVPEALRDDVLVDPELYECAEQTVEIAVDGVCTKKQKSSRHKGNDEASGKAKDENKRVNNRIAYIRRGKYNYTLAAANYAELMDIVLAFLLHNDLWKNPLCFYADGEKKLKDAINSRFSWHGQYKIILDWYHLQHKCGQMLSLVLKGRKLRNAHLEKLAEYLWYGCVDQALEYLGNIPEKEIKNTPKMIELTGYLKRNQANIPCYALRKKLGLSNSSNRVEKANDLLVSQRQKRNGMSWSEEGSLGLAALSALRLNRYEDEWLNEGTIPFQFHNRESEAA